MWNALLDQLLRHLVKKGSLRVKLPDGRQESYGDESGRTVSVIIHEPGTIRRLILNPELAVGEAYMNGDVTIEDDDLHGFIAIMLANKNDHGMVWWLRPVEYLRKAFRWVWQFNPASRSKRNVAHHYDLSGELYDLFLDKDRQYSCAYFRHPNDTLEQAQTNKKHHIARKLLLKPGMTVLDIGCGWGGMALTLARDYGARVVGVTLSEEQHAIATRRAQEAGLADRVEFRLMDYREVTETFDRIVSVGMIEHVGVPHYREYFRQVHDRLKPDGVALIHTIGRADGPGSTSPFIRKYIFPGGYVPAMSEAMAAIEQQNLFVDDVEVWRLHYAKTLRHWQERFDANIDKAREIYDDRFCRMWRFYLVGAEMTFRHDDQVVFQFQLSRQQDAVPLTRDYLYRDDDSKDRAPATELQHAAE